MNQKPLFQVCMVVYGVFSALVILGFVFSPLQLLAIFTWPYPFLLCLQSVLDAGSFLVWLAALAFGAAIVGASSWVIPQRKFEPWSVSLLPLAVLLDALVLFSATVLAYVFAAARGWPIGE